MQLGVYSFGDISTDPATGRLGSPGQQLKETLERIRLADELGLDWFGIGEHHRPEYSISSPATVLAAAASVTQNIRLSSAVTVLSTEDPVRVFQQFSTIDLLSGGRVEIAAGRGSFIESFPLFGANLADYDALYEEKLQLLLELNSAERVTWEGRFRPALNDALILPRPHGEKLDIWIATGGNPESSMRAGYLGLPINYAIIGGYPEQFAPLAKLYREAGAAAGHVASDLRVAVSGPGFLAKTSQEAKDTFYPYWRTSMTAIASERGFTAPSRLGFDSQTARRGAIFAGSPNEVADKMIALHGHLAYDRHALQMDWAGLPHARVMTSIELLATEVLPQVRAELS
ncbi:LLM class flavin-dependent oxidoreductase [Mycetocola zhadangensis]|uniref:LLM class flavin-dependent oxidoreductase n=1 Tax=Mycetocola zhadangensis TaxID=1164595 RepID=A0A3L7IT63_9MICO|nr:LLM class flavin-dependent oxidoreductase [Mycetocola zhadangensis]RLQ81448.1 LLM class flavin-dependent oxidoreductase [Mycetocola zhadangensis]GGF01541.1 oxidoreductase [Mycetocola zhadangensis]